MKNISLIICLIATWCHGQDLTLSNGSSITVTSNTVFFVNGLKLTPSSNFTINGPKEISRTSTSIDGMNITRVFAEDNLLSGFQGTLQFNYEDSELNGLVEADLVLVMKDETLDWNSFTAIHDVNANTLTTTFTSPINFSTVTAMTNMAVVLGVEEDDFVFSDIRLYPNPVSSIISIDSDRELQINVYSVIGQRILETQRKTIDVSQLNKGIYFFEVKDVLSNKVYRYKVLKK